MGHDLAESGVQLLHKTTVAMHGAVAWLALVVYCRESIGLVESVKPTAPCCQDVLQTQARMAKRFELD